MAAEVRPFSGGGIGIGTIVIALLGGWIFGNNPLTILGLLSGGGAPPAVQAPGPAHRPPVDDMMARFVSTVLADTEDVWQGVFQQGGGRYEEPRLVLFRGATRTACGAGQAAMGPFTALRTRRCTPTWAFMKRLKTAWALPATLRRPM